MKYYNELEQSWRKLKADNPEEAKAIEGSKIVQYLSDDGAWLMRRSSCWERGWVYRAPIKEKQPLSFEDIKQGDAIRAKGHKLWAMIDTHSETEIMTLHDRSKMSLLSLMDSSEIRSIGGEWRPCHK